jgi:hypothetical protein|tara:strand:- start:3790 stop:4773 length:984 start_codon:yes stop_codon:yes gene_type:complete
MARFTADTIRAQQAKLRKKQEEQTGKIVRKKGIGVREIREKTRATVLETVEDQASRKSNEAAFTRTIVPEGSTAFSPKDKIVQSIVGGEVVSEIRMTPQQFNEWGRSFTRGAGSSDPIVQAALNAKDTTEAERVQDISAQREAPFTPEMAQQILDSFPELQGTSGGDFLTEIVGSLGQIGRGAATIATGTALTASAVGAPAGVPLIAAGGVDVLGGFTSIAERAQGATVARGQKQYMKAAEELKALPSKVASGQMGRTEAEVMAEIFLGLIDESIAVVAEEGAGLFGFALSKGDDELAEMIIFRNANANIVNEIRTVPQTRRGFLTE